VAQVGEAITQMDQTTQQNAALVEQMAAAASSLKAQAQDLVGVVAIFKLNAGDSAQRTAVRASPPRPLPQGTPERRALAATNSPKPAAPKAAAAPLPARTSPPAPAPVRATVAAGDDEWETF
jgi:methyl-accepting chemotaxis protein-1 (serine sensor receptor)